MIEALPWLMFAFTLLILASGYPVAFCLGGSAVLFAGLGVLFGVFDSSYLISLAPRLYGIMTNDTLMAIPLFVFMGVMLQQSKLSEDLLETMAQLFGGLRGGLGISVALVGGLLAASTGIVGATVVTMGLISLPTMLKNKYSPSLSCGIVCASGTLGQIIPPSIVLIILGDVMGSAYQQAQLEQGIFSPKAISVGDLFQGAILPGVLLVALYIFYIMVRAFFSPTCAPLPVDQPQAKRLEVVFIKKMGTVLVPPMVLIIGVLGSIFAGVATPTEAASVGSVGAMALAGLRRAFTWKTLKEVCFETTKVSAMVFTILIGANLFSLVFRAYHGDDAVHQLLSNLGGDVAIAFLVVMLVMFLLGFFLDFFEITYVMVPLVGPPLLMMGLDPVWLGVMIALNLQTSFLTPPFGFSLFYLRGVAPPAIKTSHIYRGAIPFILIQLSLLILLWFEPDLVLR